MAMAMATAMATATATAITNKPMKRSEDFLLRDVAGTLVIVPVGPAVKAFPGMITVNATGKYIWELLETEQTVQTLTDALAARYEVDSQTARRDVEAFLEKLRPTGALTEN